MPTLLRIAVAGLAFSLAARAAATASIHYQGRLLDTNGVPVNGTAVMSIGLHTNPTAGAAV